MQLELAFLERRPVDPDDGSNGPWDRIDPQAQIAALVLSFAADRAKAGVKGRAGERR